jgi:electron transfer flavoprotein alpha subunit
MSADVMVLVEAAGDSFIDATYELLGKARELAGGWGGRVLALAIGPGPDPSALDADVVLAVEHPGLSPYVPEAWLAVLEALVAERNPRMVLVATTTAGMDLAGALSTRTGRPLVASVVALAAEGDAAVATSQLFDGKVLAEVEIDGGRGICTVTAGSFSAVAHSGASPAVEVVAPPPSLDAIATSAVEVPAGEDDDIDISKAPLLVSIGRGLRSKDNVELARFFADAIGASLAGTSQVCDLGWLPRTRHVGKSGVKVRPRAYLSFGIAGAPEHLEGIRESELIIACNTDPAAPIFAAAHYGTTLDALALLAALIDRAERGRAARSGGGRR